MISVDEELTLIQLAERLNMQPRTIRNYIEQGLLRGPEVGGRGARYSTYHLQRLQAIRALKDIRGLGLGEVRRRLFSLTASEIGALATEGATAEASAPVAEKSSALDYLRGLSSAVSELSAAPTPAPDEPNALDIVLERLAKLAPGSLPPRRARGEVWSVIPITPDVEIRVRGEQSADQLSRWERIADHLREMLLGRAQKER